MQKIIYVATSIMLAGLAGYGLGILVPDPVTSLKERRGRLDLPPTVEIPSNGMAGVQPALHLAAKERAPLVVDLHSWRGTYDSYTGNDFALHKAAQSLGWNFIRPNLTGPNDSPEACCSGAVIDGINAAIDFAKAHGPVDENAVFVVGASGGGYTTLCALMSGEVKAAAFYSWVPISDLVAWHAQRPDYAVDIRQCTSSGDALDVEEARRRSPLHWRVPPIEAEVKIYAGIHDGWLATVPITHSVAMYNRLAPASPVTAEELQQLLELRSGPQSMSATKIVGRQVHLTRSEGEVSLTVFEGGHEALTEQIVIDIQARMAAMAKDIPAT